MTNSDHPPFHTEDSAATDLLPTRTAEPHVGVLVRVLDGKGEPSECRLGAGLLRVGSGAGNDIVLKSRTVSRAHAELSGNAEGVVVRDLGSTNGTFYLGQRVGAITLGLGAHVQLGDVTIAIEPDTEALLDLPEYRGSAYRGIVGSSPRMRKLFALLKKLEGSLATVLIEGESGAGKEEVARAIHEGSPCAARGMVTLNCGAFAKELVASELFGHRRGAFTGAVDARKGAFEAADGGTLFLDEVGELPLDVQPALLRAIELGEIRPVGTDEARRVKVRILAATNRDLEALVAAGQFRQDLFFRLAVVRVQVPPLRGRPEDVALLAQHFAKSAKLPELPPHVLEELRNRAWTGNARELRNAIEAYGALGRLPPAATARRTDDDALEPIIDPTEPYQEQKDRAVERFTKAYLRALLRYTNGNQAAAARIGKLDRSYLSRLLTKYGLVIRRIE